MSVSRSRVKHYLKVTVQTETHTPQAKPQNGTRGMCPGPQGKLLDLTGGVWTQRVDGTANTDGSKRGGRRKRDGTDTHPACGTLHGRCGTLQLYSRGCAYDTRTHKSLLHNYHYKTHYHHSAYGLNIGQHFFASHAQTSSETIRFSLRGENGSVLDVVLVI